MIEKISDTEYVIKAGLHRGNNHYQDDELFLIKDIRVKWESCDWSDNRDNIILYFSDKEYRSVCWRSRSIEFNILNALFYTFFESYDKFGSWIGFLSEEIWFEYFDHSSNFVED